MVIGTAWYSKALFGKQWMKIIGITDKEMKQKMGSVMIGLVLVSLITAYIMSFFVAYAHLYIGGSWIKAGVITALLAWVGFATTTIFAHGLFEPRDKNVLFINTGNRLVTLLAMGLILGAFMK
jgi:hypothetical protein